MACPFFMPVDRLEGGAWMHEARLPLGGAWRGRCTAPSHEGEIATPEERLESCNLGYPSSCPRCPADRPWDSVRFMVTRDSEAHILVAYACERNHRPAEHGVLEFDRPLGRWSAFHRDLRVQRKAECYLESYLLRRPVPGVKGA